MKSSIILSATLVATIVSLAQCAALAPAKVAAQDQRGSPLGDQAPETETDPLLAADTQVTATVESEDDPTAVTGTGRNQNKIIIQDVQPYHKHERKQAVTWLGLAAEESTEALSSQLGLKPGEGLTVTFLATNSPAAKADFRKDDVLVELDGQMLVHPMQLRKLVQMHAVGDAIQITFYRHGQKQTTSVKLGKTTWDQVSDRDDGSLPGDLQTLRYQINGLDGRLYRMRDSLARVGLDKAKVNVEIQRTVDQTRKAILDSMRRASTDRKSLIIVDHELEALAHNGVNVDKDATVTVRKKQNSTKTIVQTDETGTIIIEAGAKST